MVIVIQIVIKPYSLKGDINNDIYNCSTFHIYNLYYFSKGRAQQEAKEVINDIVTGPNEKLLLTAAVVFAIRGQFIVGRYFKL